MISINPIVISIGVAVCLPVAAQAEIYKCVAKDGRISFQDSPCIGTSGTKVTVRSPNDLNGVYFAPPKVISPTPLEVAGIPKPLTPAPAPTTQAERNAAALKTMETDRRRRTIDYEIRDAETTLESLKASMEQEVSPVRERKDRFTNSVPGSALEQGASAELRAATERYGPQIKSSEDRLSELRKQRDDLIKRK